MRTLTAGLVTLTLALTIADSARALTIRLEPTSDPNQAAVYFDMEGALGTDGNPLRVIILQVGAQTPDSANSYLGAEPPPLLPIGEPGILLDDEFTSLAPTGAFGDESISDDVPAGSTRVLASWFVNPASIRGTDGYNTQYGTTPEDVLIATLNYGSKVYRDDFSLVFGVDDGFFVYDPILDRAVDATDQVTLVNNLPVPEPTTVLLVGAGLLGLGVARRGDH